jgi:hypothetical protein
MLNTEVMDSAPAASYGNTTSNNSADNQGYEERSIASNPRSQPNRTLRGGATSSRRKPQPKGSPHAHLSAVLPTVLRSYTFCNSGTLAVARFRGLQGIYCTRF